jgi:hypothetical protein
MPASVPACAGLHTRGTTLRAGIVLDGDLGCLSDLLHDQETTVSLDHARDVQVLVAREDEKTEFTIIQKTGEEGELVAERDPRSAG